MLADLTEYTGRPRSEPPLKALHLEKADLSQVYLDDAYLMEAHLGGANLSGAHLQNANLYKAHLDDTNLSNAHLEKAFVCKTYLERANLSEAHLEKANLVWAHLDHASLIRAHLEGANLLGAHLENANLFRAHLENAVLTEAHLENASLRGTWFDKGSILMETILTGVSLDRVSFDNTNLTAIDWSLVDKLGDEQTARSRKNPFRDPATRLSEYKAAVRANRILTVALQAQGLSEDASRYAYHAQVLQREVLRRQRKIGSYLFSFLIAALAGYGYRLGRIVIAYALIVSVFAAGYFFTGHTLSSAALSGQGLVQGVLDAFQISLNAIHGRVFFAQFGLDTAQSWLATSESVIGMLIQRFFGR